MKKAVIKLVTQGKHKGEFRFVLFASNGEAIAQSFPETYKEKRKCKQTLKKHFSDFEIVDQTK